jgi:hypothetical protein
VEGVRSIAELRVQAARGWNVTPGHVAKIMRTALRDALFVRVAIHLTETISAIGTDLSPTANLQVAGKARLQLGSCEYNLV